MATNNFKPFATGSGANVTSQTDWEALAALITGFQSGKASSAQVNKALRQATFIASALAQYTANKSGLDVQDDGDVAGFVAKMSAAFGVDFQAKDATLTAFAALATGANKLPYFTGTDAAALTDLTAIGRGVIGQTTLLATQIYLAIDRLKQESGKTYIASPDGIGTLYVTNTDWGMLRSDSAGQIALPISSGGTGGLTASAARSNLGLGTAATRDVGTGTNQIPGISSFAHAYDGGTRHSFDVPMSDGIFRTVTAQINLPTGITDYTFSVAFPNAVVGVMVTQYSQTSSPTGNLSAQITGANTVRFVNWSNTGVTAQYLAVGR